MEEFKAVKPPGFDIKKWTVIGMAVVKIALMIIYVSLTGHLIRHYLYTYEDFQPHQIELTKTMYIVTMVLFTIFSITFSLFGLVGAYNENLCLITTYAILCGIELIATLINSIKRPYFWASTIWVTLCTVVVLLFMRDLYTIQRQRQNQFRAQVSAYSA